MLDVGDVRHAVHELGDIGGTAGGFQIAAAVKLVGERYQVDGLLRLTEGDHLLVDAPVMIVEEVFGFELLECGVERVVVEQDRAQDAALRLRVLGQLPFERHGWSAHLSFALYSPVKRNLSIEPVQKPGLVEICSIHHTMREDDCRFPSKGTTKKMFAMC